MGFGGVYVWDALEFVDDNGCCIGWRDVSPN